jgi:hypothetical protein
MASYAASAPLAGDKAAWSSSTPYELRDGDVVLGSILSAGFAYHADPSVSLSFAVTAAHVATTFTISSALLSFPSLANPDAAALASITVTDNESNGATMTPDLAGAYLADYNGFVPAGSMFASFFTSALVAPAGGSASDSASIGPSTILASVHDMSARFSFTVSAGDTAAGTSTYCIGDLQQCPSSVVPEPATAWLLLTGVGVALRARRTRKSARNQAYTPSTLVE